jgi:hypothetical protein
MRALTLCTIVGPLIAAWILANLKHDGGMSRDAFDAGTNISLLAGWIGLILVRWQTSILKWLWYVLYPVAMLPATGLIQFMVIGLERLW